MKIYRFKTYEEINKIYFEGIAKIIVECGYVKEHMNKLLGTTPSSEYQKEINDTMETKKSAHLTFDGTLLYYSADMFIESDKQLEFDF